MAISRDIAEEALAKMLVKQQLRSGPWAGVKGSEATAQAMTNTANLISDNQALARITPEEILSIPEMQDYLSAEAARMATKGVASPTQTFSYPMSAAATAAGLTQVRHMNPLQFSESIQRAIAAYPQNPNIFAEQFADRVNMLSLMLDSGNIGDDFYPMFNEAMQLASLSLPPHIFNIVSSTASSRAAPIDEVIRVFKAAPHVRVDKQGMAFFDEAAATAAGIKETDNFVRNTGKALAEAINDPDFLRNPITGQSGKTNPYTINRLDPKNPNVYVGDTVDQQGQVQSLIGKENFSGNTSTVKDARANQMPGRVIAEAAGLSPSRAQSNTWGNIRLSQIAEREGLPSAFVRASADKDIIDVMGDIEVRPDVAALAEQNFGTFVDDVRAGNRPDWTIDPDTGNPIPVRDRPDLLIPAEDRKKRTAQSNIELQKMSIEAAKAVGRELKKKRGTPEAGIAALAVLAGLTGAGSTGYSILRSLAEQQVNGSPSLANTGGSNGF